MKLSGNEEMLRHKDVRRHPSGFIMHTAQSRTDLGAHASKVFTCWLRPCVGRWYTKSTTCKRQTKYFYQLKFTTVEWLLLGSHDKLGGADWITNAQDHANNVNLKWTKRKTNKQSSAYHLSNTSQGCSWMVLPLSKFCQLSSAKNQINICWGLHRVWCTFW